MHALSLCRLGGPGSKARVPDTQAAELIRHRGGAAEQYVSCRPLQKGTKWLKP